MSGSTYEDILVDTPAPGVRLIKLNRPKERNALRTRLLAEIADALTAAEIEDSVRCVVLAGDERAFAAGADIREMADRTVAEALTDVRASHWRTIQDFPKPMIAAVRGYCLGGGNELAMCCDVIVAGEGAMFGQPEIKLGMVPGAGGTQRLTAAVGKAAAMKLILTGEMISAREAYLSGLVSEVLEDDRVWDRTVELASLIAAKSPLALRLAKEAVKYASEGTLTVGFALERRSAAALFATEDRREGISAFLEKRTPEFKGR